MNKAILLHVIWLSLLPFSAFSATSTPAKRWIFTTSMLNKEKVMSIQHKEFCRPFAPALMSSKCRLYKGGYVCRGTSETFVIATYPSKQECEKNLKKAKHVLARR